MCVTAGVSRALRRVKAGRQHVKALHVTEIPITPQIRKGRTEATRAAGVLQVGLCCELLKKVLPAGETA